jgi:AraC family transcriptional regulator
MSSAHTIAASPPSAMPAATASLHNTTLSELARALQAHLRSGTAREPALERALLDSIEASLAHSHDVLTLPPSPLSHRPRATLSQRNLRKVEAFIDANLSLQFSVDDIARAACLSPFHLGRAWHCTTGQSLWQYVLQRRVTLACSLIRRDPDAQLGDIAAQSGFVSYSQFIAVFRRLHGVTPGIWRRMLH